MDQPWTELIVQSEPGQLRLDIYLSRSVPGLSRTLAKTLIGQGAVTLNGAPAKKNALPKRGDQIAIWVDPQIGWREPAADGSSPLSVLYEDEVLLAVDKPSGMPSVPLFPNESKTLAGSVVSRYPGCAAIGRRPGDGGLIQRLDRDTSGVVLVARNKQSHNRLIEMQKLGGIEKRYVAAVAPSDKAVPKEIDAPLASFGPGGRKVRVSKNGQTAATELKKLGVFGKSVRIEATIRMGQRHQIRVHLAHAGFPILGDTLYNHDPAPTWVTRLLLHAGQVRLRHPITGSPLSISAELPTPFFK